MMMPSTTAVPIIDALVFGNLGEYRHRFCIGKYEII